MALAKVRTLFATLELTVHDSALKIFVKGTPKMPFLKQFLTFSQKFPFLKNIFGTSCDFHNFAEKFSKNFEPQNPLDFWLIYCVP
jgi:hypothetical protein